MTYDPPTGPTARDVSGVFKTVIRRGLKKPARLASGRKLIGIRNNVGKCNIGARDYGTGDGG